MHEVQNYGSENISAELIRGFEAGTCQLQFVYSIAPVMSILFNVLEICLNKIRNTHPVNDFKGLKVPKSNVIHSTLPLTFPELLLTLYSIKAIHRHLFWVLFSPNVRETGRSLCTKVCFQTFNTD